jgi:hypothetical protein
MENDEKVRENRLRRMADRQGYRLLKSRRRDPLATDFGTWQLARGAAVTRPMTLDEVEERLSSPLSAQPSVGGRGATIG